MNAGGDDVWAGLPPKAEDLYCVAIIEALLWIGEPLSALDIVDALDGYMSMWEAASSLELLERLGVVKAAAGLRKPGKHEVRLETAFRLAGREGSEDEYA